MILFAQILALVLNMHVADYSGTWTYSLSTPDGTVKGEMLLEKDGDEYAGTLTAYGQPFEMTDMTWEDSKLTFKTNAGGYSSKISGTFEGDTYTATIYVEGYQIPMVATRE